MHQYAMQTVLQMRLDERKPPRAGRQESGSEAAELSKRLVLAK